ncbi:MAG: hypothetical protein EXS46_00860 [Candidatus Taylorbacteria bacterium]|nr:hypothetical protein [Candidatus Taylorbacteria bacterium]
MEQKEEQFKILREKMGNLLTELRSDGHEIACQELLDALRNKDHLIPVTITDLINKAVTNYRDLLEKHSGGFNIEAMQLALDRSEFAVEQFALLRRRVEAKSSVITRRVRVNRGLTPQEALDTTVHVPYIHDKSMLETMPRGEGDEVEVVFFRFGLSKHKGSDNIKKCYDSKGLKPADPYSLIAVNADDSTFADDLSNVTCWEGTDGELCFISFRRYDEKRRVYVMRPIGTPGRGDCWVAGFRK